MGVNEGTCDAESHALQKVIAGNLYDNTYKVPTARRSPGYDAIQAFQISDIEICQIFGYWQSRNIDKGGYDAKEATCKWVSENIENLQSFIPRTYPRSIE